MVIEFFDVVTKLCLETPQAACATISLCLNIEFGLAALIYYTGPVASVIEKQAKRWTYEEYYKLDGDQRYEIIDGDLLMAPSPDVWHQNWNGNLYFFPRQYLAKTKAGRLFIAPFDVVFDSENTVQPDLIFIASANVGIIEKRAIFGSPNLLVELI
jgi:Uma2 family endonuclease